MTRLHQRPDLLAGLRPELAIAEAAARAANAAILEVRDEALKNPTYKPNDAGPVTAADLAADEVIRAHLQRAFPDDLVITEETWVAGTEVPRADRVWIVDPLDGTKDFVRGGDDYAPMIGLVIEGIPRVGVVSQPATDVLWRAISADDILADIKSGEDVGDLATVCERVEADGTVSARNMRGRDLPAAGPRFALSRNHTSPMADYITEKLGGTIVRKGSVGLKIGLIVDDEADAYLSGSSHIKVWDTAAPAAILHAAGGAPIRSLAGDALAWSGNASHLEGIRALLPAAAERFGDEFAAMVKRYRASSPDSAPE